MNIDEKISTAFSRLDCAIRELEPIAVFALFSGGHDSLSATLIATMHPNCAGVVHINTGIGIPATRAFVRETCACRKWCLLERFAAQNLNAKGRSDPQVYEALVNRYGFPGPGFHGLMYSLLKERPLRMIEREAGASCRGKKKRRVLYVTGARSAESVRRMGNVKPLEVRGRTIWTNPIHDWTKLDTTLCLEVFKAARNPVVDLIHKSGECLCGAFANSDRENELEELNLWDLTRPAYLEIKRLEAIVKPLHGWGWGERPPKNRQRVCASKPGMLCQGCKR